VGVVRGATNRFLGLYDQVKRVSPLLQFGLEKVEQMPWKKADPVIDVLDNRIITITQSVSSKVTAIQSRFQTSKAAVTASATNITARATRTSEKWKDLRGELTKKAGLRIEQGLSQAREFSATRGKEIIHIDLIQYSRDVIDGASDAVTRKLKPVYDPIARNLAASVQKASQAASQLRQSVVDVSARANLRLRLKQARRAARELSSNGVAFAQAKYGDLASRIPDSSTLHKGLQFIAASPELFKKIKDKADLDASRGLLENLNHLVLAIRDVVCQSSEEEIPTQDISEIPEQVSGDELRPEDGILGQVSREDEIPAQVSGGEEEISEQVSDDEEEIPAEQALGAGEEIPEQESSDEQALGEDPEDEGDS